MRSGSSRHRGCRLSRYGHSPIFGRAAIGRFHAFASKTAKSQERFAEPTGMSRSGARRVFGADRPEALVRPPFATRVEPARDSVDPFRDVVCRIFPGKTTVPHENPNPTGCLLIYFSRRANVGASRFLDDSHPGCRLAPVVSNKIGTWPRFRGLVCQPLTCERHVESSCIATRAASDSFDPRGRRILLRTRPERRRRW